VASLYFTIIGLATVGFGDITPGLFGFFEGGLCVIESVCVCVRERERERGREGEREREREREREIISNITTGQQANDAERR
jgi:hypothetical protein